MSFYWWIFGWPFPDTWLTAQLVVIAVMGLPMIPIRGRLADGLSCPFVFFSSWKMHFLCFLENKWSAILSWDAWYLDAYMGRVGVLERDANHGSGVWFQSLNLVKFGVLEGTSGSVSVFSLCKCRNKQCSLISASFTNYINSIYNCFIYLGFLLWDFLEDRDWDRIKSTWLG